MQQQRSFTSRIASFSFRHKWYVLGAWLVLLVTAGMLSTGLGSTLTTDFRDLSHSDSRVGKDLIDNRFGARPLTEELVVRSDADTVDSPAFQSLVTGLAGQIRGLKGVKNVQTYLEAQSPSMVSADRHAALTAVTLSSDEKTAETDVAAVVDAVKAAQHPDGYALHLTGPASVSHEQNQLSEKDISKAEMFGMPIALVVMLLAFGTVVAAGVPLLLGFAAIVGALGIVALIGKAFALSFFVTNIITMIGLAVGIDYSLFIIGRYREELKRGRTPAESLAIASDSSGRAVFFSGITVLLALAGMLFVRNNIFVSIGIGAMVVVLVAVFASLTLLPALLGMFGRKISSLRIPYLGKAEFGHRFWGAVTHAVQRRPLVFLVGSVAILVAAALPLTQINLGSNGVESLPHNTDSYQGIKALERDFSAGVNDPVRIVVDGDVQSAGAQSAIAQLQQKVAQDPSFQWLGVQTDKAGQTALIEVSSSAVDTGAASKRMVNDLRADTNAAFQGSGVRAYVAGSLPGFFDVKNQTDSAVPVVFAFVLGLSFLLLLMVFRSVAIPTKAILMNLLSVAAAYGLIVAVFQKGFLASQLGFQKTPQVEFWLPLFLFSILFGLSMDYHVFLLSRVKEEYDNTGDNSLAVREGVRSTAGMITSAAIIMVAVFAAFSRSSQVSLQQMGFGLAIAVFMDATIIRSILVPSAMQLLGSYNWWMPSWLGWLPKISVEGSAAQAADAEKRLGLAAAD
jgi:RND superfamily putative drug exporter